MLGRVFVAARSLALGQDQVDDFLRRPVRRIRLAAARWKAVWLELQIIGPATIDHQPEGLQQHRACVDRIWSTPRRSRLTM